MAAERGTTTSVEIREDTLRILEELAQSSGEPVPELLQRAVKELRRKMLMEEIVAEFAKLREDPEAWEEELEERRIWDVTLADGLD